MIDEAYRELNRLEAEHWWFRGARAAYRTLLSMRRAKNGPTARVLEVGSGSGGNFELLREYGPVVGLEYSPLAIGLTSIRPELGLVRASADALPFADGSFTYVALFGLIEHMDDDLRTMQEAARVCAGGGVVALLTSALAFLWSHHDEANRHRRRYSRNQLRLLLYAAGLRPIRISFQNFFTFLPVLAVRALQRLKPENARFDVGTPPRIANAILTDLLLLEAWLIRYLALPIGVDLVAVAEPVKDAGD